MPRDNEHTAILDSYKKLVIKEVVAVLQKDFETDYREDLYNIIVPKGERGYVNSGFTLDDICDYLLKGFEVK